LLVNDQQSINKDGVPASSERRLYFSSDEIARAASPARSA
jgi:hypothetical protein